VWGVMGSGLHGPAGRPMPQYRLAPERPLLPQNRPAAGPARIPLSDHAISEQRIPLSEQAISEQPIPLPDHAISEHRPAAPRPGADLPVADLPVADLPAARRPLAAARPPGRRQMTSERPPVAGCPAVPDYPTVPPYLSARDNPVPDWPPARVAGYRVLLRRLAAFVPRRRAARGTAGRRAAVLGYLSVPAFPVPLAIYLTTLRGPRWARQHAANAVNVWCTGLLYDLSAVIMGAMLALGSPQAALIVFAPLVAARWLVTLACLARAARAASRGAAYGFPAWLCMRIAR